VSDPITIRLDESLERLLDTIVKRTGRTRSEVIRDALRRQLLVLEFEELRRRSMPYAEAAGFLTDEDVFRELS
jgi:metal-responsive CopG/Arc/MetJ family transcriptional regulator